MAGSTDTPWANPLLRWAGSKRKLLPVLMEASPRRYTRYVEPFAGSACFFFALRPKTAVLGDVNTALIATYDVVRRHPRRVARLVRQWPATKASYYRIRYGDPSSLDDVSRAARFVYLNRHCFNGVYRVNRQGQFNVPKGVRTGRIPAESAFYRCSVALRAAKLVHGDFALTLEDVREGDFVYLDPPYATTDRTTYGEYGYDSFGPNDMPRLIEALTQIDSRGAHFLISFSYAKGQPLKRSGWHWRRLAVQRHVAGFAQHRRGVYELLVANFPLPQRTR